MDNPPSSTNSGREDPADQTGGERSRSTILIAVTVSMVVLCLLSIPQKILMGADPFAPKGFLVPAIFGLLSGLTIGILLVRNKQEYQRRIMLEQSKNQELVASEERFRLLAENARDVIFVWSLKSNRYEYLSPSTYNLTGHLPEEFYVNPGLFSSIVDPEDRHQIDTLGQKLRQGELPPFLEYRLRHRDGQTVWINQRHTVSLDTEGEPKALEGICTDMTAFHQERLEKTSLQQQLLQSQKMEAIGRLAGGIAHDFNNLLTVINGYADLLLTTEGKSAQHGFELQEIQKAGRKASDLTSQLLSFSRNQATNPRAIDPGKAVRDSQVMIQRMIHESIHITTEIPEALPTVFIDPTHLDQILVNLVLNARDAVGKSGNISINLASADLTGEFCSKCKDPLKGEFLVLTVTDDGCGILPEDVDRVFDPFFTTKEVGKGTGLGLSTVFGIVHQVQGHLQLESHPGQGSTFRILLPHCAEENLNQALASGGSTEVGRKGQTILVVEDEALVRSLASTILQQHGYKILLADNGETALEIFAEHADGVDLILTDIVMPRLDGIQMAKRLGKLSPQTPILFMSGYLDDILDFHDFDSKTMPMLKKPFGAEELVQRVNQVFEQDD